MKTIRTYVKTSYFEIKRAVTVCLCAKNSISGRLILKNMFIIAFMVITTGCVSDATEELPSRSIRVLFAEYQVGSPITIIELVEPNDFRVISLGIASDAQMPSSDSYAFLEDFTSAVPQILTKSVILNPLYRVIRQEERMELSPSQFNDIMLLVDNLASNAADREFELVSTALGHLPYVWAIVDGNMYWTYFSPNINHCLEYMRPCDHTIRHYVNVDLMELATTLIGLSPLPVGSDGFGIYNFWECDVCFSHVCNVR